MKFKNFEEFYLKAHNMAVQAKVKCIKQPYAKQAVLYARNSFTRNDMNSYYNIGILKKEQLKLLQAKNAQIKFSIDSLIKNMIKHPEITYEEYLKISDILKRPDKISLSKSNINSILLFKLDSKYYQIVIKTTLDRKENFLTSFRLLSEEEFNKY